MKRISTIIMALVLALGLTQCKKEQPVSNDIDQGETYTITLNVSGKASGEAKGEKAVVNPSTGSVDYETGDQIHVASNGKYVGTLTYNGTIFTGTIANAVEGEPLQFYFLGNVTPAEELTSGVTESCSVVITDQTQHLPVISGAPSTENFSGEVSNYTAHLLNKCALVKFNVTTASTAATCVTGFNNKVTIDFGENTFTNSQEGNGGITLPAGNGEKWAILLPQAAMTGGNAYAAGDEYAGTFGAVPAIYTNGMFTVGVPVEVTTSTHNYLIDLSTLTGDYEAVDGDTLTGTLTAHHNITVAEGASVTLWNASINPGHSYKSPHNPCIRCDNDATIVIEGENDMYVWTEQMPCIYIASGKTLTITGNGSLNASSTGMITAAIGGCYSSGNSCGNIVIESGNITANGGSCAAIGGGYNGNCGDITINGGTIQATSTGGTAIGCGNQSNYSCGDITINGGNVTATGSRAGIGGGYYSSCGDITITGGTVIASGNSGSGIGAGLWREGNAGLCGNITISGGNVTASSTGGVGIGGGQQAGCGDILISGGTVTATGGNNYVAIGASTNNTCGTITITEGVESVTAKKGANAPRCIGLGNGDYGLCGTVTIGGTVYPDGATPNQTDGLTFVYPVPTPTEQIVDLLTITSAYTAVDGDILTGTLGTGVQISIEDGATITLRSANINGSDNLSGTFHGLNCLGDATIILENNDNVVKAKCGSSYDGRAGIFVPRYKTLTIQAGNSSGKIDATGAGEAAGIGGYHGTHCGAIVINSGKVTAEAGSDGYESGYGAGIGACGLRRCDGITITGGQTIARAYGYAAAIGTGGDDMTTGYCNPGDQDAITINISSGDGWVKAYKGSDATYFIGGGGSVHCGYVKVGGINYEDNGNRGITSNTPTSSDLLVGETSVVYMP